MRQVDLLILYPRKGQISQFGLRAEAENHADTDMETVAGGLCAAISGNFIATKTQIVSFLRVAWIPERVEEGAKKRTVHSFFQFAHLIKRNERGCWRETGPFP